MGYVTPHMNKYLFGLRVECARVSEEKAKQNMPETFEV